MQSRVQEQFIMYPLTADEKATCQSMLQTEYSNVLLMPSHHINELGDMMGFRFVCNPHAGMLCIVILSYSI